MAVNPPSPPSAFCQVLLPVAPLVLGEPLSCVPPNRMSGLVGCTEKETNSVIEPRRLAQAVKLIRPRATSRVQSGIAIQRPADSAVMGEVAGRFATGHHERDSVLIRMHMRRRPSDLGCTHRRELN